MRHRFMLGLVPILALSLAGPQAGLAQPAIPVYVDGQLVNFDVPPAVIGGRVLVPLRGVFERLGATVDYDAQTQHIVALRGGQTVELTVGSRQARVNGLPALLDVSAFTIAGRTMVPLRFVSEALGAGVRWVDASRTILIDSGAAALPAPRPSPAPPAPPPSYTPAPPPRTYVPPAPATVPPIAGQLVSVVTGATPFIVVAAGGQQYKLSVAPSATVGRYNADTRAGGPVGLEALQPGDTVTVTVDPQYQATRIVAFYRVAAQPSAPAPVAAPARPFAVQIVEGKIVDANFQARTARLDNGRTVTALSDVYIAHDGGPADFGAVAAGRRGRFWVLGGTNQAVAVDVTERMEVGPVEGTIVDANFKARTARLAGGEIFTAASNAHITRNGGPTDFGAVAAGRVGRFWVIAGTRQAVAIDLVDAAAGPGSLPAVRVIEGWIVDANFRARTARLANGQTLAVLRDAYVARDGGPTDFGAVAAGRYGRFWVTEGTTQSFLVDLSEPAEVQIVNGKIVDANFRTRAVRLANGQTFTVAQNAYIVRNGGRTDFGAVAAGRSGTFWVIQGANQAFLADLRDQ